MSEKCEKCGFPLDKVSQFVVMGDKSICMGCYEQLKKFSEGDE